MKYNSAIDSSNYFVINRIVQCVFNGVLMISTILLNSVAILTISKSSQFKEKLCYFLVLVQSSIDLVVGVIIQPLFIVMWANDAKGNVEVHYIVEGYPIRDAGRKIVNVRGK
jgi:purine-cytosine permease-like protein